MAMKMEQVNKTVNITPYTPKKLQGQEESHVTCGNNGRGCTGPGLLNLLRKWPLRDEMCECRVATSKQSRSSSELSRVLDCVHRTMGYMGVDVEDHYKKKRFISSRVSAEFC